jgi:hypothetical protein
MTLARVIKLIVVLLAAVASIAVAFSHRDRDPATERASTVLHGWSMRSRWRKIWATTPVRVASVAVIAAALLISRTVAAFTTPQLVIEDAGVFWLGQYTRGFRASLFQPFAGYLHVIPRIISGVADWFPYAWAPVVYVWSAAVVTGWTAATIASLELPPAMGVMLGVSIVLVAHNGEVWATATNLQWIMATALPLIASTEAPSSLMARANQFAFVALASLSGPFSVIAAPMWIYRSWRRAHHRRFDLALCGLALFCAGSTLVVIVLHADASPEGSQFLHLAAVSLERSFAEVFFEAANRIIRNADNAKAAASICVSGLLVTSCFAGRYRKVRVACLWFLCGVAAATAWRWRADGAFLAEYFANERYFYPPMVMLAFCAVTLLFEEKLLVKLAGVCLTTLMAGETVNRFEKLPPADYSEEWAEKSLEIGRQSVDIQYYPGWRMTVPRRSAPPP